METALTSRALMMAINLRHPPRGLMHHSDRASQYASQPYRALLRQHGMECSMSCKGTCWDDAPTQHFFCSLKREWLTGNVYPTRDDAVADARAYIAYSNSLRQNKTLGDHPNIKFEQCALQGIRLNLTRTIRSPERLDDPKRLSKWQTRHSVFNA
jgi:transposase InsO family protein